MHPTASEVGSVTAEFATLVPAVCLVLALSLGSVHLATRQLQLQDAAALAARSEARGGDGPVLVSRLVPGATARRELKGNLVCIRASVHPSSISALLGFSTISAASCALAGGQ
ncbi:MAG: hypothetical protein ABI238_01450 [Terrimesophilobacter sp.]